MGFGNQTNMCPAAVSAIKTPTTEPPAPCVEATPPQQIAGVVLLGMGGSRVHRASAMRFANNSSHVLTHSSQLCHVAVDAKRCLWGPRWVRALGYSQHLTALQTLHPCLYLSSMFGPVVHMPQCRRCGCLNIASWGGGWVGLGQGLIRTSGTIDIALPCASQLVRRVHGCPVSRPTGLMTAPVPRGGTRGREMPPCLCVWGARAAWGSVSPGAPGPGGEAGGA